MSAARPDTWMPLYWGDYAKATAHLSAAQHGAYLMLLKHYWSIGGPFPEDDGALWRIACADSPAHWRKLKPVVLAFFRIEDGVLRHARVERELEKARRFIEAQSLRGQKGGRPPRNSQTKATAFAGDMPGQSTSPAPSPAPARLESLETGRKANAISADFKPSDDDLAWLATARPDIGPALLDSRMEDFRLWLGTTRPMSFNAGASWRSFMKRTHLEGTRGVSAPRTLSTTASPLPPAEEWAPRLKDYRPGRFWSPMWGPRPESGQCHAPAADLAKWRAEHGP
jgi:uncharacterized protein YdaU (DUF1376 family)